MPKSVIEGSLVRPPPDQAHPPSVSEPFLTEEGARHFAVLLTKKGYAVAVQTEDGQGRIRTISGAELVRWLNA